MQVLGFPGCCTAKVIVGFGQEQNAGYSVRATKQYTIDEMKAEIHKLITGYQIGSAMGIVTAALTSRQTIGIKALTELGWMSTGAKKKRQHGETDLLMFFINPKEYIEGDIAKEMKAKLSPPPSAIPPRVIPDAGPDAIRDRNLRMIHADTAGLDQKISHRLQINPWLSHAEAQSHEKALARRRWYSNFGSQPPRSLY